MSEPITFLFFALAVYCATIAFLAWSESRKDRKRRKIYAED